MNLTAFLPTFLSNNLILMITNVNILPAHNINLCLFSHKSTLISILINRFPTMTNKTEYSLSDEFLTHVYGDKQNWHLLNEQFGRAENRWENMNIIKQLIYRGWDQMTDV